MVNCESCNAPLEIKNNLYICANGHVSRLKVEELEDVNVIKTKRIVRRNKKKPILEEYDTCYQALSVFTLFFYDMKKYYKLKSSRFFELYLSGFEYNGKNIKSGPRISYCTLEVIVYLTKRLEYETENVPLFFNDFARELERYPYIDKQREIYDVLNMHAAFRRSISTVKKNYPLMSIYECLLVLGRSGWDENHPTCLYSYASTGVLDETVEYIKLLFRKDFRRDWEISKLYFMPICEVFCVEVTPKLLDQYKAFVYYSDNTNIIPLHEYEACFFIFSYLTVKEEQVDLQNIYNTFVKKNIVRGHTDEHLKTYLNEGVTLEFAIDKKTNTHAHIENWCGPHTASSYYNKLKHLICIYLKCNKAHFEAFYSEFPVYFDNFEKINTRKPRNVVRDAWNFIVEQIENYKKENNEGKNMQ